MLNIENDAFFAVPLRSDGVRNGNKVKLGSCYEFWLIRCQIFDTICRIALKS